MKKLQLILLISLLGISFKAAAQDSPVPVGYSLKEKDDYAKYVPDVIKTIDWLQQTPWADVPDKRKEANAFVVAWITGSPTVNLSINSDDVMKLCTKNGELLMSFIGGYVKYILQSKAVDEREANLAGVKAIIAKYQSQSDHVQDDNVEHFIQMQKDGKLDDWVKANFNKPTGK
jgi:hypothetical protein